MSAPATAQRGEAGAAAPSGFTRWLEPGLAGSTADRRHASIPASASPQNSASRPTTVRAQIGSPREEVTARLMAPATWTGASRFGLGCFLPSVVTALCAVGIAQSFGDALVGGVSLPVDAVGVDLEQDGDAVPGAAGDLGRGHPGVQPQRHRRVPQVAGPPGAALARRPRRRPGRQVAPLVFSAWDSATRNAATAVVNSGDSTPPAPPAPCQVTSQVIVAVAWNAPPGCPALELV
jgi:hypothetical protein